MSDFRAKIHQLPCSLAGFKWHSSNGREGGKREGIGTKGGYSFRPQSGPLLFIVDLHLWLCIYFHHSCSRQSNKHRHIQSHSTTRKRKRNCVCSNNLATTVHIQTSVGDYHIDSLTFTHFFARRFLKICHWLDLSDICRITEQETYNAPGVYPPLKWPVLCRVGC